MVRVFYGRKLLSKLFFYMNKNYLIFFIFLFLATACTWFDHQAWRVKLGDFYLSEKKIDQYCSRFSGRLDSVSLCQAYVQNWIDKRLLADWAIKRVDSLGIEEILEENRLDLILGAFYKDVLQKELEASIVQADMESFYEKNQFLFPITQPIIQIFIIARFKNDTEAQQNIKLLFDKLPLSAEEITAFLMAHQLDGNLHHTGYRFEFLQELKLNYPFLDQMQDKKILKNLQFTHSEEDKVYHIYVLDYKDKGVLPFYLAQGRIKLSILAQKKENYLSELVVQLKDQAMDLGRLKYH